MAPKRKSAGGRGRGRGGGASKKAKASPETQSDARKIAEKLLSEHSSYCDELGIKIATGGSQAAFQWLCCSIIFGNRISEKTTIRAAKGLIKSGLTDPKSVKESDLWEKIEALNSQGNVQRGPSMSKRMEATAATILEKYDGDLDKLREAAGKDPEKERQLVKEFKVQLNWQELYPFADERTLEMAGKLGLPSGSPQELSDLVNNDRAKFVQLLAAVVKAELRGGSIETNNDEKGEDKEEEQEAAGKGSQDEAQGAEQPGNEPDEATKAEEEQQDEKDGEEAKSD